VQAFVYTAFQILGELELEEKIRRSTSAANRVVRGASAVPA